MGTMYLIQAIHSDAGRDLALASLPRARVVGLLMPLLLQQINPFPRGNDS